MRQKLEMESRLPESAQEQECSAEYDDPVDAEGVSSKKAQSSESIEITMLKAISGPKEEADLLATRDSGNQYGSHANEAANDKHEETSDGWRHAKRGNLTAERQPLRFG